MAWRCAQRGVATPRLYKSAARSPAPTYAAHCVISMRSASHPFHRHQRDGSWQGRSVRSVRFRCCPVCGRGVRSRAAPPWPAGAKRSRTANHAGGLATKAGRVQRAPSYAQSRAAAAARGRHAWRQALEDRWRTAPRTVRWVKRALCRAGRRAGARAVPRSVPDTCVCGRARQPLVLGRRAPGRTAPVASLVVVAAQLLIPTRGREERLAGSWSLIFEV